MTNSLAFPVWISPCRKTIRFYKSRSPSVIWRWRWYEAVEYEFCISESGSRITDPVVEPKLLMTDPFLICEMPFKTKSFTSVMNGLRGYGEMHRWNTSLTEHLSYRESKTEARRETVSADTLLAFDKYIGKSLVGWPIYDFESGEYDAKERLVHRCGGWFCFNNKPMDAKGYPLGALFNHSSG